ncbi:hypothetical protein DIPPA_08223 [Diplonema papillatum]|nr:hypothetical protein DIPPA_08223 [Diplonema papillatum]
MKNATTAPAFRLWTPTGETFPGVGASAVGFGKTMTDIDTKWFNKDAWRIESFLKRGPTTEMWIDPSAIKNAKGGSVSAVFGYDDMERNIKYRGTTDDSLNHTSELAYTLPLQNGVQRVKASVKTSLDKGTFVPNTQKVETKLFWKAMMPQFTAEAILKQTASGPQAFNVWVQGEVTPDIAYGGIVEYDIPKGSIKNWELGVLDTLPFMGNVLAARFVTRNAEDFELGVMPPPQLVSGKPVNVYTKVNHNAKSSVTDVSLATEVKYCSKLDLKARFAYMGLNRLQTAFAAIWAAPNGWRVAASITDPGTSKMLFGVRFAQGSTPAPL